MDGLSFIASLSASWAWPIVALAVVVLFRDEFAALIRRVRRGKIGAAEFELEAVSEQIAQQLETRVESPPAAAIALAGTARGTGQAAAVLTATGATDDITSITDLVDTRVIRSGSLGAEALLESVKRSSTPEELAARVSAYVELRTAPALRDLSNARIGLEQDLFMAILELQTHRARGGKPADAGRLALAVEVVRMFWVRPEVMSDEAVADAAALVRGVMAEMLPS